MKTTDSRTAAGVSESSTASSLNRSKQSRSAPTALTVEQVRSIRSEIIDVLGRKVDGVQVAGTARWLATELGATTKRAIAFVEAILADLQREGLVTTRRLRSGEMLWKLTDKHHAKWQQLAFAVTAPAARRPRA